MTWVKRIAAAVGLVLLFASLVPLFLSKERLCNAAIDALAKEEVTLCYEKRRTSPLGCETKFTTLLFAHSPIARIKRFSATPWRIEAEGVRLVGMAQSALPPRIAKVEVAPLEGAIRARGDFGTLEGRIDWLGRKVTLTLQPSSLMRRDYRGTLRHFKPKNGKYLYETAF
ncbi:hypothetical protein [Hydrogenimonas sp.]